MNLQRREEIRELIAEIARYEELGATLDLEGKARDAITELLAHIDTLEQTAAERVIADGSRGPTPDYTGEGSAWVPPAEAAAVVVPDDDRPSREFLENYVEGFDPGERSAALFGWREGRRHLRENSRAIPADRVLGEGMVAVTPEYLDAAWGLDDMSDLEMFMWFRDNQEESGSDAQRVAKIFWREAQEWKKHQRKKFDALRASQGGGAA